MYMNTPRILTLALALLAGMSDRFAAAPLPKLTAVPLTEVQIPDSFWSPRRTPTDWSASRSTSRCLKNPATSAISSWPPPAPPMASRPGVHGLGPLQGPRSRVLLAGHPSRPGAGQAARRHHRYARRRPATRWLSEQLLHRQRTRTSAGPTSATGTSCTAPGHLFEAAVAHFQATGKRSFLDVATKLADHIDSVFGPAAQAPGLSRSSRKSNWRWSNSGGSPASGATSNWPASSSRIAAASSSPPSISTPLDRYDGAYWQDDVPDLRSQQHQGPRRPRRLSDVRRHRCGRRNRRSRPCSAMLNRVWRNTTERNMYLTGGIGPERPQRGVHGGLRPAQPHRLPGNLRPGRAGPVESPPRPALRRRPVRRRRRTRRSTTACWPACRWTAPGSST